MVFRPLTFVLFWSVILCQQGAHVLSFLFLPTSLKEQASMPWHFGRSSTTRTVAVVVAATKTPTHEDGFSSSSSSSLDDKDDNNNDPSQPRPRRPRYTGKYPRNFHEKYKEHSGDEQVITKVLEKGMTPAGTHVPIMPNECLQYMGLTINTNQQDSDQQHLVVDCTLGYGGHSKLILKALQNTNHGGVLWAFDQDAVEIEKTSKRLKQALVDEMSDTKASNVDFIPINQNFASLQSYLETQGRLGQITCLLADLGLSSMQIDDNQRGFTYKRDGPLDMRMNPHDKTRETAHQLLQRLKPKQLQRLLEENSDEEYAKEIAFGILGKARPDTTSIPQSTLELADRVREIVQPLMERTTPKKALKAALDSTVARTMQAIRIEVNGEFQALEQLMKDLPEVLAPGGKAVFLTFHSGEDRRVKKSLKAGFKTGIYSSWSRHVVRPSSQERRNNPRSSCCKLRWAVRSDD